jgi:hypothetical protein
MKNFTKTLATILLFTALITGCGKKASDYNYLVKEYKEVVCIGMDQNASMTEKNQALQRQMELNTEYEKALESLSQKEKAKLILAWSHAMAEVSDGNCD